MFITNTITEADAARAAAVPLTPVLLASAYLGRIEAFTVFADEFVVPVLQGQVPDDRGRLYSGLFYRALAYCKSAAVLNAPVHQQVLTGIERSMVELAVDMALVHHNVVPDALDLFLAFVRSQKLKSARRAAKFFDDHPEFDTTPSIADPQREFVAKKAAGIEADETRLWPGRMPQHWSRLDLIARASKISPEFERLATDGYDIRNFSIHPGLAGVAGLEKSGFETLCMLALLNIGSCLHELLKMVIQEFRFYLVIDDCWETLQRLDESAAFVLVDKRLQTLGEEPRFLLHTRPAR